MLKKVCRGDIYKANFDPTVGSEQGGLRPVLIVQNDIGNRYSKTTIVVPITTKVNQKPNLPTHCKVCTETANIPRNSLVLAEQIRTIDKVRLVEYMGFLPSLQMKAIDKVLAVSIGL